MKSCLLFQASTVEGMFAYLEEILVPLLTDMSASDHEYPSAGSNHFLVGPLRLRQQRIKTGNKDVLVKVDKCMLWVFEKAD